jgi:hypothetical protein
MAEEFNMLFEGDENLIRQIDFNDTVTQIVLRELVEMFPQDTPLNGIAVIRVIAYVKQEEMFPTDGNDVAISFIIKHLYGILAE